MSYPDRMFKPVINRCDLCANPIDCHEDVELKINVLNEIDDSFESDYDKKEPRLMICIYCQKEYLIPSFI